MGLYFISLLVLILCVLLSVAFFTLLERKVLGYIQLRKGPNKVGLGGLPQPLADALKLFIKEYPSPSDINYFLFLFAPLLSLFLSLMLWILYPLKYALLIFFLGLIFFLCVSSLNVYSTLLAGWASNSKYALLGALRAIAQTISYEVSMALFLLSIIFMFHTFDLNEINLSQFMINILFMPLLLCWIVTNLAETNRAPFDFAEGESEIVSGFNVEYSSGGFAMLFMAEYGSIMLMCFLTTALFFGMFLMVNYFMMILIMVFFNICFLWVRGSFPRFRYDQLMMLTWKNLLPYSLSLLMMIIVLDWVLSSSLILSYFK